MTRFYKLTLSGYGGYSAYIELTKDSYDYWHRSQKNTRTDPLLDYIHDPTANPNIPPIADFLDSNDWQDCPKIIAVQDGIDYRCCNLNLYELPYQESKDYVNVIDEMPLQDYAQDYDNMISRNYVDGTESHYMLQIYNARKGIFFETTFTTVQKFNPNNLKLNLREFFNGDYLVETVHYDNDLLKCENKDLTDRGISVNIWKSR